MSGEAASGSRLRGSLRLAAVAALTLVLLALRVVLLPLGRQGLLAVRSLWCRWCCRILGIGLEIEGLPFGSAPTLFVANHVGYLDILVLGAALDATFIAKAEVGRWPVIGFLARQCGTLFIRRDRRDALVQRNQMAARMRGGESFVLFAEGTSSSGRSVLRFRSSLLSVLEPWVVDRPVAVQSVAIAYRRLAAASQEGGREERYAWWGDATLLPHLWQTLCLPGMRVELRLGEPLLSWDIHDRKDLAARLQGEVSRNLLAAEGARRAEEPDLVYGR